MEETKDETIIKEQEEKKWFVYMHRNLTNNKRYVGITSQNPPEKRWGKDGKGYQSNIHFWRAIQKYGWDNFEHQVVFAYETQNYACKIEQCLIKHYNTKDPKYGYNLTDGGDGPHGWIPNENTRQKMRENHANVCGENNPMYGKPRPYSVKLKISEKLKGKTSWIKGKHLSDEAKEKLRKAHTGLHAGEKNPMYGISPQERMDEKTYQQWLQNLRLHAQKEEVKISKSLPVYCVELDEIFYGAKDAKNKYNISNANIGSCCKGYFNHAGKHPVTKMPLHWLYVNDYIRQDGTVIQGAITLKYITQIQFDEYLSGLSEN